MLKHFSEFRKAVAALYVFIVISVTVLCGFYYSYINKNTQNYIDRTLQHLNALMSHGVNNLMTQNESLMTILGLDILRSDPTLENRAYIKTVLEKLVAENPSIVAIGIATPDGQLQVISGIDLSRALPNYMGHTETRGTFQQTLQSDRIVIGRTYNVPFLKNGAGAWVIPIRKKITFEGKSIVVSIGLSVDTYAENWKQIDLAQQTTTYIIRTDGYLQFTNSEELDRNVVYFQKFDIGCKDKPHNTLLEIDCVFTGKTVLANVSFDKKYGYYTLVTIPTEALKSIRYNEYKFLLFVYLGLLIFATIVYIFVAKLTDGYESNLLMQASRDSLTKLPNRSSLHKELERRIKDAQTNGHDVALFFIDLDDFKHINDTYNHFVGDKLLIEIARRLKQTLRRNDFIARLGGDEFVVVVSNNDNRRRHEINVYAIATAIKQAINQPLDIVDTPLSTNASIGIARYPVDSTNITDLLRKADLAMYESKKQGKNLAILYSNMLEFKTLEEYELRTALKNAIKQKEFTIVYQKQIHAATNKVVGLEALVRWENKGINVSPDVFIPLLEQMQLVNELGEFVIQQSIKDFAKYIDEVATTGSNCCDPLQCVLSLNMSPLQMKDKGLVSKIVSELNKYNLTPKQVEIEITESALIHEAIENKVVEALSSAGFSIAIDDFGTGYSNLKKLNTLPINVIKIDQSFIKQIGEDDKSESVILSIMSLAERIGINIIAEGVETDIQLDFLTTHWNDIIIQGYYYGRPVDIDTIIFACIAYGDNEL